MHTTIHWTLAAALCMVCATGCWKDDSFDPLPARARVHILAPLHLVQDTTGGMPRDTAGDVAVVLMAADDTEAPAIFTWSVSNPAVVRITGSNVGCGAGMVASHPVAVCARLVANQPGATWLAAAAGEARPDSTLVTVR